jgi:hypothetical protein
MQSSSESPQSASSEFIEFLQEHQLSQQVTRPTRHRQGQISSLLDLVIISSELSVSSVLHTPPVGKSDHDVISFHSENCIMEKLPNQPRYNFKSADYVLLNDIISSIRWDEEFSNLELNDKLDMLQNFLQNIIKTFIPLSKLPARKGPSWNTPEVRLQINRKKRAYVELKKTPNTQ